MKKHPLDIQALFQQKENLLNITEKAIFLLHLNKQIKKNVDSKLAAQIRVANVRNNTLIIETTNSTWAARINYLKKSLLQDLKINFPDISFIEVKVTPKLI